MGCLVLTEPGTRLCVKDRQFVLRRAGRDIERVRFGQVDEVLLFGGVEISGAAARACLRLGVDVIYLTRDGRYRGRLVGDRSKHGPLRFAQVRRACDPVFALDVARRVVWGKIENQRQLLLRAQRELNDDRLASALGQFTGLQAAVERADDLEVLRGLEGRAARLYFDVFGLRLRAPGIRFTGRNRRPPRDPVNACLSFGYGLLRLEIENCVLRRGLDPMVGFLHQVRHGTPALVLDLMEEWRPVLVDRMVVRLFNRRQLTPADFGSPREEDPLLDLPDRDVPWSDPEAGAGGGEHARAVARSDERAVHLKPAARAILIRDFRSQLRDRTMRYAPRNEQLRLGHILREQVNAMAREVMRGDADPPVYQPFVLR